MTDDEKEKYKVLADKYNSSRVTESLKQINDLQTNSNDFWNMQKYLTKMFECIPNDEGENYYIKLMLSSTNYI